MTPILISSEKKIVFVFLCLACITISFNVAALAAVLPSIAREFAIDDLVVSRVIFLYMIPYGIFALMYAPLTKYVSYKNLLVVGMLFYGVMSLYCSVAETVQGLLVGRVMTGLSGACAIPLGLIIIGKLFSYQQRGRTVGMLFSSSFIASMAGLITSGLFHWRVLFLIPGITGILTAMGILLVRMEVLNNTHKTEISYIHAIKQSDIQRVFIFILCISALYHGVHNWMGIYIKRLYILPQLYISIIFIAKALCGAAGQIIGGFIADKKSRYFACLLGVIVLALATISLPFIHFIGAFIVILCLMTAGWTIGHNGISTYLTDFPETYRPQIASLNSSVRFIAGGIGFYMSGFLVQKGFPQAFLTLGILMALNALFLKFVMAPQKRK